MADLDVSDLLLDLDFVDSFNVIRNTETVGTDGIGDVTTQTFNNVQGVVQPQDSSVLVRVPDGSLMAGDIVLYTQFALTAGLGAIQADVIQWHGAAFTVRAVEDWSSYGTGFIKATATMQTVNP